MLFSICRLLMFSGYTRAMVKRRIHKQTLQYDVNHIKNRKRLKFEECSLIPTQRPDAVNIAVKKLKEGKVIGLPTDTVYGVACSANDSKAIISLYQIKGRNEQKPVAICVATIDDFRRWGKATHLSEELLQELLPGPVTIVVKRSNILNRELNPGVPNIGIRITNNRFIQDVCEAFDKPIALTSANKSSSQSTLNVTEFKTLWPNLGAVFDGGQLGLSEEQRAASTVIDLSEPDYYTIIRRGVAVDEIIETIQKHNIRPRPAS